MAARSNAARLVAPPSAYVRLRGAVMTENRLETLVDAFAAALAEDGIESHGCARIAGSATMFLFGDSPALVLSNEGTRIWSDGEARALHVARLPSAGAMARVRGYAALYVARGCELLARAQDATTGVGLNLCQRFILGRLLLGDPLGEIARRLDRGLPFVEQSLAETLAALGVARREEAVAIAARRGWLVSTETHFGALSPQNIDYYS